MDQQFRDFQAFLNAARQLQHLSELDGLLRDFLPNLGLDYFAITDLSSASAASEPFRLISYPDAWIETIVKRGYAPRDPILAACGTTSLGFVWSEVSDIIELNNAQKEILVAAGQAGMGEGFTVPIHIPGEPMGMANFCVQTGKAFPRPSIPLIHYTGCFAFEFARRLFRQQLTAKSAKTKPVLLTDRQYDCIVLAAQGKTDWEAGRILGISHNTVHKHIEAAKISYGVTTRVQLIVQSLYNAQLTFEDLMP